MGSELYAAGVSQVAVTLTPGQGGVFKVTLNGEVAFDKSEVGRYPVLSDSKELMAKVITTVEAVTG